MNPNDSLTLLPSSIDLEESIIGAILLEGDDIYDDVMSIIPTPSMMYLPAHTIIWECLQSLHENNIPIDQLTLADEIVRRNKGDAIGGIYKLAEYAGNVGSTSNVTYHAKLVLEDYKRRDLIKRIEKMRELAYQRSESIDTVLAELSNFDSSIATSSSCAPLCETIGDTIDEIDTAFKNPGSVKGINTGISILNKLLGGWQPGEINILAARPSVGKTALALFSAMKCGVPSYFVSAEMTRRMVEHRLIGSYLGVPSHTLKSGKLLPEEHMKLSDALQHLQNMNIYIEDKVIDSGTIAREARRLKKERNIGIVFIDYLQLLDPPKDEKRISATQSREREISVISSRLKRLSKELDIPVVALSQLSRESERAGRRPILSDLRESGSLEQDADTVIFLHRDNDSPDYLDCIVAKNRNGGIGSETIRFHKDIGEFSEIRIGK
jgi:replicative DNA helicase